MRVTREALPLKTLPHTRTSLPDLGVGEERVNLAQREERDARIGQKGEVVVFVVVGQSVRDHVSGRRHQRRGAPRGAHEKSPGGVEANADEKQNSETKIRYEPVSLLEGPG
jgi:hypothetical protein